MLNLRLLGNLIWVSVFPLVKPGYSYNLVKKSDVMDYIRPFDKYLKV